MSLGNLGIAYPKAKELIEKHGSRRVEEVIEHAKDQNCKNMAGYIIRALAENWDSFLRSKMTIVPTMMESGISQENMRHLLSINRY